MGDWGSVKAGIQATTTTPTTMQSSVEQFGLTITFDQAYPAGQFINGDWFIVGSPTVTSVSPAWDGTHNGSMVNPQSRTGHGYRSGAPSYSDSLRVSFPRQLAAGDTLIHTEAWQNSDPDAPAINPTHNVPRPAVRRAMALTCLSTAPPVGSFRPPYSQGPKELYNEADLKWSMLPTLTAPASAPDWTMWRINRGPWIDHQIYDLGRYIQPSENMHSYGREIGRDANETILKLCLDYPQAEKRDPLIGIVQAGIDLFGCVRSAKANPDLSFWWGGFGGGIGTGRKWPILFAGLMLGDTGAGGMVDAAANYGPRWFQEDGQTYISGGGSHELRAAGLASWGERAATRPTDQQTGIPGNVSYRVCCTANVWSGAALAARIMGAVDDWNWAPFFEYQDWYTDVDMVGNSNRFWTTFLEDMWTTYRQDF